MTAHATLKNDTACSELERNLAEEIARAMRRQPPLMNRLASAAPADAARAGAIRADRPPAEIADAADVAGPARFNALMENFDEPVTTPASTAQWLGKARRERNRARVRNAVAWLATLVIGGAIISATFLLLPD